ncbi:FHA domain-containing protein [Herbaspirillum autotrophicum]|uniref:FHA domain-containing protein n=1 Tax=Herbaspirillum autotrophicum TaxID=180195 RepID=UPI000A9C5356|nr:FHA domain-containing protein [Herbaspirillum autotrophicum]
MRKQTTASDRLSVAAPLQTPDANMYLVVRNGLHAGARVLIPETQWLVLGNGANADIALLDDGIRSQHVLLKRQADVVLMTALSGAVHIFDVVAGTGRRYRLPDGTLLLLAGVECFIGTLPVRQRQSLRAQRIHLLRRAPLRLLRLEWNRLSAPRKWIALMATALLLLIAALTLALPRSGAPWEMPASSRYPDHNDGHRPGPGAVLAAGIMLRPGRCNADSRPEVGSGIFQITT